MTSYRVSAKCNWEIFNCESPLQFTWWTALVRRKKNKQKHSWLHPFCKNYGYTIIHDLIKYLPRGPIQVHYLQLEHSICISCESIVPKLQQDECCTIQEPQKTFDFCTMPSPCSLTHNVGLCFSNETECRSCWVTWLPFLIISAQWDEQEWKCSFRTLYSTSLQSVSICLRPLSLCLLTTTTNNYTSSK